MKAFTFSIACVLSSAAFAESTVVQIVGITQAKQDVYLSLAITGRLAEKNVAEGQRVKAGDTLLKLEGLVEQLEVKRRHLLLKDKSEWRSAKQQAEIYKSIYQDAKLLHDESGAISGEELKRKKSQYILLASKSEQLAMNEKREAIEYQLAIEKLNLGILKAPFSGVITKIWFDQGESAEANKPLLRLVDSSQGYFTTNVEEHIARKLQTDQLVNLHIQAGEKTVLRVGKVVFISPVTDPASNLVNCKVLFDNADGEIKLGVSGRMEVL